MPTPVLRIAPTANVTVPDCHNDRLSDNSAVAQFGTLIALSNLTARKYTLAWFLLSYSL